MIDDPEYQALTDQDKAQEVEEAIRQTEDYSKEQMTTRIIQSRLGRETSSVPLSPPQ